MPALFGKPFPPKSDTNAWEMSLGTFSRGFKRTFISGALSFSESGEGPLFTFQLHPLHVELSHRLGRRFGNDRFIEVSIPVLEGRVWGNLIRLLQIPGRSARDMVIEWLHQGVHEFLGRTWGLFYIKDKSRKKTKSAVDAEDAESPTMKRICFFATSGTDFKRTDKKVAQKDEPINNHSEMTVEAMLNWLLSLPQNGKQSFLKFYSRISLGKLVWCTGCQFGT